MILSCKCFELKKKPVIYTFVNFIAGCVCVIDPKNPRKVETVETLNIKIKASFITIYCNIQIPD